MIPQWLSTHIGPHILYSVEYSSSFDGISETDL